MNNICVCQTCSLESEVPAFMRELMESYKGIPNMHYINRRYLPSRAEAIEIINLMLPILFPGYFGRQDLTFNNVNFYIGELVMELSNKLCHQAWLACSYQQQVQSQSINEDECRRLAQCRSLAFIRRIPALREMLAGDIQAAYDGDPAAVNTDEIILSYPGLLGIIIYRISHELYELQIPLLPRIMTEYAHSITGIDIHPGAKIGRNFFIDHGTGVVIGETTDIGENVKVYQGVTLGALSFPKDERGRLIRGTKRHPTIENNVTIYANATILGGTTVIGEGAVIGGNVFVTHSVPSGCTVSLKSPELKFKNHRAPEQEAQAVSAEKQGDGQL